MFEVSIRFRVVRNKLNVKQDMYMHYRTYIIRGIRQIQCRRQIRVRRPPELPALLVRYVIPHVARNAEPAALVRRAVLAGKAMRLARTAVLRLRPIVAAEEVVARIVRKRVYRLTGRRCGGPSWSSAYKCIHFPELSGGVL